MRAYFATVATMSNRVVSNQLPFPLNIRLAIAFWNGLNFTSGRYRMTDGTISWPLRCT